MYSLMVPLDDSKITILGGAMPKYPQLADGVVFDTQTHQILQTTAFPQAHNFFSVANQYCITRYGKIVALVQSSNGDSLLLQISRNLQEIK